MKRCPFPGEESDCDKGETSRFKPDKFCKKYCFVCPCWDDQETHYDWKGNLIEDVCQTDGIFTDVGDCTNCSKFLEILPADHDLCAKPPPASCRETLPNGQDICMASCGPGKECFRINGKKCRCRGPCEDQKPNSKGQCHGLCPITGKTCYPDGAGKCTCVPDYNPCFDLSPDSNGQCPPEACTGEGSICVALGGGCTCVETCEGREPGINGECPGTCPISGNLCFPDSITGKCACLSYSPLLCEDYFPDSNGGCPVDACADKESWCLAPQGGGCCYCQRIQLS